MADLKNAGQQHAGYRVGKNEEKEGVLPSHDIDGKNKSMRDPPYFGKKEVDKVPGVHWGHAV